MVVVVDVVGVWVVQVEASRGVLVVGVLLHIVQVLSLTGLELGGGLSFDSLDAQGDERDRG